MKSKHDEFVSDLENRRLFEREVLALEASELVIALMKAQNVSKSELASILGTSRAHISQLLNGSRNMTLVTLADLAHALGQRIKIESQPLNQTKHRTLSCSDERSYSARGTDWNLTAHAVKSESEEILFGAAA
jgi:transcriptional regulator with XRE-family HTH domain